MKKLSLFVSAFALCASASYAAIDCGTLPTCSELGYNDKVSDCPSSSEVLKCPFDKNYGKCQRGPTVGDLKYSLKLANHDGWILCNGQSLDVSTYSALHAVIGTSFGSDGTKFRVPDYRGFFLRAAGAASYNKALSSYGGSAGKDGTNITNLATPQKEELPNIKASWYAAYEDAATLGNTAYTGAISITEYTSNLDKYNMEAKGETADGYLKMEFNAHNNYTLGTQSNGKYINKSNSTTPYTDGGHVIPANYPVNVFIYAGK